MKAAAILIVLALAGCATKPPCPVAQVHPIVSNTGAIWFLIDEPNTRLVQARFRGIREGDCTPGDNWAKVPKGDL